MQKIDRSELSIWAEGTQWSTDELEYHYANYLDYCKDNGVSPVDEARWANEIWGIPNGL